jgi:predicted RNase H-like HicB family nuclease
MRQSLSLTALIERGETHYVATCPELGVVSQGQTREEAKNNLQEALDLFFEVAPAEEIQRRLKTDFQVSQLEVAFG